MKTCTKCGETKPITEFIKDASKPSGIRSQCKPCKRIYIAAYRAANPGNRRASDARYRATNRDKVRASAAKWAAANPDKLKSKGVKYRAEYPERVRAARAKWNAANTEKRRADVDKWQAANPEKVKASSAKWAAANREALRIRDQNRRARELEAGGNLSKGLVERLFKLQRGKCACGCKQQLGDDYHRDHILPLALGGTNTDDNVQLLRATCNLQKHAKHPVDFMQGRGFLI